MKQLYKIFFLCLFLCVNVEIVWGMEGPGLKAFDIDEMKKQLEDLQLSKNNKIAQVKAMKPMNQEEGEYREKLLEEISNLSLQEAEIKKKLDIKQKKSEESLEALTIRVPPTLKSPETIRQELSSRSSKLRLPQRAFGPPRRRPSKGTRGKTSTAIPATQEQLFGSIREAAEVESVQEKFEKIKTSIQEQQKTLQSKLKPVPPKRRSLSGSLSSKEIAAAFKQQEEFLPELKKEEELVMTSLRQTGEPGLFPVLETVPVIEEAVAVELPPSRPLSAREISPKAPQAPKDIPVIEEKAPTLVEQIQQHEQEATAAEQRKLERELKRKEQKEAKEKKKEEEARRRTELRKVEQQDRERAALKAQQEKMLKNNLGELNQALELLKWRLEGIILV